LLEEEDGRRTGTLATSTGIYPPQLVLNVNICPFSSKVNLMISQLKYD
jgi:hypothetical protein